jgi:hypothetical protein
MTSVSFMPLGTVPIIRAKRQAQVVANSLGELAKLDIRDVRLVYGNLMERTYAFMVLFPSLLKMRRSELVLLLRPNHKRVPGSSLDVFGCPVMVR